MLSTLWPVADESTSLLMGEFYRLRMRHSDWTKLDALRTAQLEMLRGKLGSSGTGMQRSVTATKPAQTKNAPAWPTGTPRFSHPYYWAPFVLTGNWQ